MFSSHLFSMNAYNEQENSNEEVFGSRGITFTNYSVGDVALARNSAKFGRDFISSFVIGSGLRTGDYFSVARN